MGAILQDSRGKAHVSKMGAILLDSHLDTRIARIEVGTLTNVVAPRLEYPGEVWEGSVNFVKQLETVQMAAAKKNP